MNLRRPTRRPIGMVVVQPTPFCNINCSYCYLPQRTDKTMMPQSTVRDAIRAGVRRPAGRAEELTVIWHAGEPLVVPPAFYEGAFQTIAALRPGSVRVRHSMQTNGMLMSTEWCDLFKSWHVGVGVSIDGPRRLQRRTSADAHRQEALSSRRLPASACCGRRRCRSTSFQCSRNGAWMRRKSCSTSTWPRASRMSASMSRNPKVRMSRSSSRAMSRNADSAFSSARSGGSRAKDGRIRFIREIDGMLPRVFRPESERVRNMQVEPFGMLNVDCNGNVSTLLAGAPRA